METLTANLPDDLALCHQLINELLLDKQKSQTLIEKLQHQMEQMLRYRYGQRADRIDPNQLKLFIEQQLAQAVQSIRGITSATISFTRASSSASERPSRSHVVSR